MVAVLVLFHGILIAQSNQAFKTFNDVGTRGIRAVGNRNIGCSGRLAHPSSLEAQLLMGRSYAQQVETTSKLISDPDVAEYVNRIGQNLARNSETQVQLTFKIVDTDEVNAFSLPGGFIFVDSGVLLAADNEAELAGVISHELAHVMACHDVQEIAREDLTEIASMPLIVRILCRRAIRNVYLKPTRSFEAEADFLAVEYLHKAGYDPEAVSSFLQKVQAIEKRNRARRLNALESDPPIAGRIKRTQQEIDRLLPSASDYKLDTSEFQDIKKRLVELENRQNMDKNPSGNGPRLNAPTQALVSKFQASLRQ